MGAQEMVEDAEQRDDMRPVAAGLAVGRASAERPSATTVVYFQ